MGKKRNKNKRPHPGRFRGKRSRERGLKRLKTHTKLRGASRYGVKLDQRRQREVCQQIREGKSQFIANQPLHRQIHVVSVDGVRIAVLYAKREDCLVSVLPSDHEVLERRGVNIRDPRMEALQELREALE